jgi:hypothetical protein
MIKLEKGELYKVDGIGLCVCYDYRLYTMTSLCGVWMWKGKKVKEATTKDIKEYISEQVLLTMIHGYEAHLLTLKIQYINGL